MSKGTLGSLYCSKVLSGGTVREDTFIPDTPHYITTDLFNFSVSRSFPCKVSSYTVTRVKNRAAPGSYDCTVHYTRANSIHSALISEAKIRNIESIDS